MLLQVDPKNRMSCDQILNNETVMKKMNTISNVVIENQPMQMLGTIKLPKNMNQINQMLPKKKMYKQELEEAYFANNDVNVAKKVEIDLLAGKKDVGKPIEKDYRDNRDIRDNRENVLNQINIKEKIDNNVHIPSNQYQHGHQNKVINLAPSNNVVLKRDNNVVIIRPSSANSRPVDRQYQPKTPILSKDPSLQNMKKENNNIININNYQSNPNNQNNPNNRIINKNIQILGNQNNPVAVSNNINNILKDKDPNYNRAKINSERPQSAKINHNNINNNDAINNRIAQINQINRKIIAERPVSPVRLVNPIIKRQNSNVSPKNKSPPRNNVVVPSRPQSGREKSNLVANSNNPKKVVIEKMNYDHIKLLQNPIKINEPIIKKPNYHYAMPHSNKDQIIVNNKNNFLNAMKPSDNNNIGHNINQHLINRGQINNNNGPKIVLINQRK